VSPAEGVAEAASGPEVVVPVWNWPRCDPGVPGIDRPGAPGPLAARARGRLPPPSVLGIAFTQVLYETLMQRSF